MNLLPSLYRPALFAAAMGLTLAGGFVHGRLMHRWGRPAELVLAAQRLTALPQEIGPWKQVQSLSLSEYEQAVLDCQGYVRRVYRRDDTGQQVQVSLLLGPAGPTSVHTPEMCLGSGVFTVDSPRSPLEIPSSDDCFWTVTFRGSDVSARPLRVVYAWRYQEAWEAPPEPRVTHGMLPYLYKLQIVCQADAAASKTTCEQFLKDFLPVANSCLVHGP